MYRKKCMLIVFSGEHECRMSVKLIPCCCRVCDVVALRNCGLFVMDSWFRGRHPHLPPTKQLV